MTLKSTTRLTYTSTFMAILLRSVRWMASAVRHQRRAARKALGAEDHGAAPSLVARDDDHLARARHEGHARALEEVAVLATGHEDLPDWDAVRFEDEHAALVVHGDVDVAV